MTTNALPFKIPENDYSNIQPDESDALFNGILNGIGGIAAPIYSWAVVILTILFVTGTLVMILSALFKNGQWQKYGQITMLMSFLTMLVLRGLPIIILSIQSSEDVDLLLRETLSLLGFGAVFLCLISVSVSFLFNFGYQLIAHPEFHRWAKNLRGVAALMLIFAIVMPWLFPLL